MDRGYVLDGRYRLVDRLGEGGMSVVWRAHDDVLGRDVAVKVLSPRLAADAPLVRRIHLEARAAAGLRHPNIVQVYDYGQQHSDDGRSFPYVVMELVEGRSLEQLLSGGALPWRVAVLVGAQVAAALAAAHDREIAHRDVKPSNVMVNGHGVKLVDFGISASIGDTDRPNGELLGTPAYLAPERLNGGPVHGATDVYALGLLLYRMLTGHLPWNASTTTEMLKAHLYHEPAALPRVDGLPPEVVKLCRRCLAKRPDARPAAAQAAATLGRVAGVLPSVLTPDAAGDAASRLLTEPPPADTVPHLSGLAPQAHSAPNTPARRRWRMPSRRGILVPLGAAVVLLPVAVFGPGRLGADSGNPDAARLTGPAAAAPANPPKPQCSVRYAMRHTGDGRFSTAVTIAQTGKTRVKNWRLTFTFPSEQHITRGWAAQWQQTGRSVQARGGTVEPHAAIPTGFDATYRNTASLPTRFQLNGTTCQAAFSVTVSTTPPAAAPPKGRTGDDDHGPGKSEGKSGKGKKKGKNSGPS
ncbi:serine/threonine-protein kinase [Krasilnikovia cinnamomea]|uniref:non-specific serine/threonine protein kinase n=1 Tax=Krasilnikovia cinnamomea TaxID=349313 RepID=A0A4V2G7T4_9ACTN|nr:serine/threonine-protein kinase [Krasilnikovia cinnamomea]RZU53836.1 serine/threonine-protein kinase [Krasilnikovia cinnamomea]